MLLHLHCAINLQRAQGMGPWQGQAGSRLRPPQQGVRSSRMARELSATKKGSAATTRKHVRGDSRCTISPTNAALATLPTACIQSRAVSARVRRILISTQQSTDPDIIHEQPPIRTPVSV